MYHSQVMETLVNRGPSTVAKIVEVLTEPGATMYYVDVEACLKDLARQGLVESYEANGREVWRIKPKQE